MSEGQWAAVDALTAVPGNAGYPYKLCHPLPV